MTSIIKLRIRISQNLGNGVSNKNAMIKQFTRVIFYVRREVDLMKTANVNAYIMHIFGKIELLSIHAT